jgi:hypothetical protein
MCMSLVQSDSNDDVSEMDDEFDESLD